MVARPRLATALAAGSMVSLAALGLAPSTAVADETLCPKLLLGDVCDTVDAVVETLVPAPTAPPTTSPPTTAAPAPQPAPAPVPLPSLPEPLPQVSDLPLPAIPLLPGPTSPVPSPSSPPSNEGDAPASSTSPGAGDASPTSHPAAATSPAVTGPNAATDTTRGARPVVSPIVGAETARGVDWAAPASAPASPFVLGPAPMPSAPRPAATGASELAASSGLPGVGDTGSSLPRPTGPITLAVLLVAGVAGAHGVRWIDRQLATAPASASAKHRPFCQERSCAASSSGVDTGARHE